jgi:hypothetical protein
LGLGDENRLNSLIKADDPVIDQEQLKPARSGATPLIFRAFFA